jgi:hypothetical protein
MSRIYLDEAVLSIKHSVQFPGLFPFQRPVPDAAPENIKSKSLQIPSKK